MSKEYNRTQLVKQLFLDLTNLYISYQLKSYDIRTPYGEPLYSPPYDDVKYVTISDKFKLTCTGEIYVVHDNRDFKLDVTIDGPWWELFNDMQEAIRQVKLKDNELAKEYAIQAVNEITSVYRDQAKETTSRSLWDRFKTWIQHLYFSIYIFLSEIFVHR